MTTPYRQAQIDQMNVILAAAEGWFQGTHTGDEAEKDIREALTNLDKARDVYLDNGKAGCDDLGA